MTPETICGHFGATPCQCRDRFYAKHAAEWYPMEPIDRAPGDVASGELDGPGEQRDCEPGSFEMHQEVVKRGVNARPGHGASDYLCDSEAMPPVSLIGTDGEHKLRAQGHDLMTTARKGTAAGEGESPGSLFSDIPLVVGGSATVVSASTVAAAGVIGAAICVGIWCGMIR